MGKPTGEWLSSLEHVRHWDVCSNSCSAQESLPQFSSKFLSALLQLAPALFCVAKPLAKWSHLWQRRSKQEVLFAWVITSNSFDTKFWGLNRNPCTCPFLTGSLDDLFTWALANFVSVSTEQQVMLLNGCVLPVESKQQQPSTTMVLSWERSLHSLIKREKSWNEDNWHAFMGLGVGEVQQRWRESRPCCIQAEAWWRGSSTNMASRCCWVV